MKKINIFFPPLLLILFVIYYLNNDLSSTFILYKIRLPRLIMAFTTGASLAGVGYIYQMLLNNPLADPYILGVSSGAALGSVVFGIFGMFSLIPLGGFVGSVFAMSLVWMLVYLSKNQTSLYFILSGVIVSMFCSAFLSLIMYLNHNEIGYIITIIMGNLGRVFSEIEWKIYLFSQIISLFIIIFLYIQMPKLSIASLGDEHALSVGLDVKKLRIIVILLTAFITGICVSFSGMIGFIGLIIPHIVRLLGFKSSRICFIYSLFVGGFALLISDYMAQNISIIELPVGIITAFLGSPMFAFLLLKKK